MFLRVFVKTYQKHPKTHVFHTRCHGNNIDDDDYYDQDDDLHVRVYSRKNDKTYLVETMLLRMLLLLFVVVVVIQFLRPFVVTCSPNVPGP